MISFQHKYSALTAAIAITLVACGGSITNTTSLTSSESPINEISVNDTAEQVSSNSPQGTVDASALEKCPAETMSPADMSKLNCMVGRYVGIQFDEAWRATSSTGVYCEATLNADGSLIVSSPGDFEHQHELALNPVSSGELSSSRYQYLNRGNVDFNNAEKLPTLAIDSVWLDPTATEVKSQYAIGIKQLSPNTDSRQGSTWQVVSRLDSVTRRCGGPLATKR